MLDILVIDDDDTLRQSLLLLLDAEGFKVTGAASGLEALELAGEHYFDLVLCDVRMPGMSGLEAIKQLKGSIADAYFIVMTGYASEDAPIEALRLGVDDYLRKPFDLELFLEKIRGVARRRAPHRAGQEEAGLWRFLEALEARSPASTAPYRQLEKACEKVASGLGWAPSKVESLRLACWLHPLASGGTSGPAGEEAGDSLEELAALLGELPAGGLSSPAAQLLQGALSLQRGEAPPQDLDTEVAHALAADATLPRPPTLPGQPSERLILRTLGGCEIALDGRAIPDEAWESAKARWLFVYLVTRKGQSLPQERLAELFWPGASTAQKAHRGLVSAVHRARKALGQPDLLASYDRSYGFARGCSYWLDAERLAGLYTQGAELLHQGAGEKALAKFTEMAELYSGDFLPTCHEPWAVSKRAELKQRMVEGLERGAGILLDSDPAKAEKWAGRAISLDATSEPAYALLIRAQSAQGRRAEALKTYQRCAQALAEALGLKPGSAVEAAHAEAPGA
jgi:two-component SAPR family response regulator